MGDGQGRGNRNRGGLEVIELEGGVDQVHCGEGQGPERVWDGELELADSKKVEEGEGTA